MEGIIKAWCERCGKLKVVDSTVVCEKCRKRDVNKRRWSMAVGWREDGAMGDPIHGLPFPDSDNEEEPLCTRCRHLGDCGVISVDDEHLLSGCDLWEPRRSKEQMRSETAELVKNFPHDEYAEDIGKGISRVGKQLESAKEVINAGNDKLQK